MKTLLFASALIAALLCSSAAAAAAPAPATHHAFCRTQWSFSAPCAEVRGTIVQQIKALNPMFGCADCQYKLVASNPFFIRANHTSADGLSAERITLKFGPDTMTEGCRVFAQSISLGFTKLLDDGLNYCNLYNLLSASGLTTAPGFEEVVNEWACLGFGLATCTQNEVEAYDAMTLLNMN